MSRVLLDENIPVGLRLLLDGHDVFTVDFQGWKGLTNGRLLAAAEAAHFDVFISADRNLRFQQRIVGRSLAMIFLSSTSWNHIKRAINAVKTAVDRAEAGPVTSVQIAGGRSGPSQ